MRDVPVATEKEIGDEAARVTGSSKSFDTPEFMKGKFRVRAGAAQGGTYGNSVREALDVIYALDGSRLKPLTVRLRRRTGGLRFLSRGLAAAAPNQTVPHEHEGSIALPSPMSSHQA
ncbi:MULTISPECIES: hypothetical protein [unclassified Ensifer]|nr:MULTISPECIES: hypothetical protein [unclassified Ensifer]SDO18780.1 hypothetical protein SAMN05216328_1644 [Ensifer sp. YR511]